MHVSRLCVQCPDLTDQHKLQIAGTCFVLCTANQQFALGDIVNLFYHCVMLLLFATHTRLTLILVFAKITGVSSANQCILGSVCLRSNLSRVSDWSKWPNQALPV